MHCYVSGPVFYCAVVGKVFSICELNCFRLIVFLQNPLLDGGELTTYIGTVSAKPGSPDNSASFSQWQKKGVL